MTDECPGGFSLEEILADDDLLDAYERVVPGSAERFRVMGEREAAHREWMADRGVVSRGLGEPGLRVLRRNRWVNRVLVVVVVGVVVALTLAGYA